MLRGLGMYPRSQAVVHMGKFVHDDNNGLESGISIGLIAVFFLRTT